MPTEPVTPEILRGGEVSGKRFDPKRIAPFVNKLFQPHTDYRTLDFSKTLSTRMVQKTVNRWADGSRFGDTSPHDPRGTAITRALETGLTYRQVQMMSKHRDPKTVMRYDHGRENLDQKAVNFLRYEEE